MTSPAPHPFRPAEAAPRCTVGLLTWNAGADALACLTSLHAQSEPAFDLIWIDNASHDGTVPRLLAAFPTLPAPHVNPVNLGFCKPHNDAIAACRTPYYLALNQDVVLEPDYIRALCDWMDEREELALVGGLILMLEPPASFAPAAAQSSGEGSAPHPSAPRVYSAGMAFPRARFAFELGMGGPIRPEFNTRRLVPAVDGAAMLLRVAACRRASFPAHEIFPESFFAYGEEVDLAQRLARLGLLCGVEGAARASHRGQGSGGLTQPAIRARFLLNHWLVTLRNDAWFTILRDLPYILRGELSFWLPEYLKSPAAVPRALAGLLRQFTPARRFYKTFEAQHGPTTQNLQANRRAAQSSLRALR